MGLEEDLIRLPFLIFCPFKKGGHSLVFGDVPCTSKIEDERVCYRYVPNIGGQYFMDVC